MAFSRMGTMFFISPVAALRNVRQSLVPGGKLAMAVWRRREDNLWLYRAQQIVEEIVQKPEEYDEPTCGPGPFSMANADTVSDVMVHAGWEDISLYRCDLAHHGRRGPRRGARPGDVDRARPARSSSPGRPRRPSAAHGRRGAARGPLGVRARRRQRLGAGLDLDSHGDGSPRAPDLRAVELDGGRSRSSGAARARRSCSSTERWATRASGGPSSTRSPMSSPWSPGTPGVRRLLDPPEDFGLAGYADCLADFIHVLGLEPPRGGLSFGSGVVLELLRRHPEVPRSLVLVSPTPAGPARWGGRSRSSAARTCSARRIGRRTRSRVTSPDDALHRVRRTR